MSQQAPHPTPPEPKRCIGCGRKQEPDGSLPCVPVKFLENA